MSEAPNIDVGNKGEMDGTNTTATDTTGGLETIAPVLDFTDGEESAVLDRQVVELVTDDVRLAGNAEIKLDLVPVPGLYLHGVFDDPRSALAHMAGFAPPESISLFDAKGQRINGVPAGNTWSADGILKLKWRLLPEPVSVDGDDATRMTQLAAHVFNLEMHLWQGSPGKPGLLELEHGPWKGRIRTLKQDPERSRDLRLTGGYRLTHVVEFDQGGGCFSGHDADRLLQAIGCFLSFANGGMCRLECPSGWDSAGKQVWARWSSPSEWRTKRLCWFDGRYAEPLVELFPGFMDRWKTEGWGDALGSAIWWYAQAISGPPIADQGIVAAQIAMERLSYEYCVRERALVSEQGFEKLWVSDRFRLLLRSLDVPIEIPGAAKALTSASRKEKWVDGPHALTEIRNRLVHSGRKRAQLEGQCYVDAWLLATQLLELTILALCSFKGEVSNGMTGLKEPVPWAP